LFLISRGTNFGSCKFSQVYGMDLCFSHDIMTQVCLLTSWIRTGFWVTQKGQQQLHIELEKGDGTGIVHALSSELILSVKLLDSKVVAYVIIDKISWLPVRSSIRAFGGWDNWEYSNWQLLQVRTLSHLFSSTFKEFFFGVVVAHPVEDDF
jgi:hypothetical protein